MFLQRKNLWPGFKSISNPFQIGENHANQFDLDHVT